MDWNIFWAAFGAIGTTLGSLITASAVVIAVKQYKQPLMKIVKVVVTSAAIVDNSGNYLMFYCISIKNRGIRTVQINSINIKGNKKVLWLNSTQFESDTKINLPVKIEPEEIIDFLIEVEKFRLEIKKAVTNKVIRKRGKLVVFVTDSLGDKYYCKTNIKIASLINSL
ncbi:hypothetical protein [Lacrimispora celerecrescens]|uniref:Uncharacterized protein n=1 Tax=[Clostridium] celerecrescens 18A TaxID=1286362 RepID=A0A2M8Z2U4_9FIRM|nr:hypothetical protein [Lacrimispora celerecrescens]PJJ27777.1 hypothetical protein H171_1253 [[Clostridium] celerecrescens 18A]